MQRVHHRSLLHSCCFDQATQLTACLFAAVLHRSNNYSKYSVQTAFTLIGRADVRWRVMVRIMGNVRTVDWMLRRISAVRTMMLMMLMWGQLFSGRPSGGWIHPATTRAVATRVSATDKIGTRRHDGTAPAPWSVLLLLPLPLLIHAVSSCTRNGCDDDKKNASCDNASRSPRTQPSSRLRRYWLRRSARTATTVI